MAVVRSRGRASGVEPLELALDSSAVAGLYERNAGRLFGYCVSRLGRREDAEDAVQTTFVHAIRGLRRGVVPLVESAWLLGIARNVCLARREAFGRRRRLEAVCDPHDLESAAAAPQTRREELIGLQDALAKLPANQRRAVLLRDWRGLSYEEIATELEVSHAAVETLIFRGRQNLAELLGEEPKQTRKRLASLGNIGSFLAAVKTAFTGGVAAVKVAAAVVAVSTAGLAVGSLESSAGGSARGETPSGARPEATQDARTERAAAGPADASPDRVRAVSTERARPSVPGGAERAPASKPGRRSTPARAAASAATAAAAAAAAAPAAQSSVEPRAGGGPAQAADDTGVKVTGNKVAGIAKEPAAALPVAPPALPPSLQAPPVAPVAAPSVPGPGLPDPVPAPPLPAPPAAVDPPPLPPVPPVAPPPVSTPPVTPPPVAPPPVAPAVPPVPPPPPIP